MKIKPILLLFVILCAWPGSALYADPLGTGFNYQGRLNDSGSPANGSYDLQFTLSDAITNGNPVGATLTNAAVTVSNGLFTLTLDFGGAAFDGTGRWLEIGVRTNGSTDPFTVLSPRQPLMAVPYALSATQVIGTVPDSQLSSNIARLDSNLIFTASVQFSNASGSFTGDGSGLIGLNAGSLLTGTIADERLSTNVALLNATQTFVGPLMIGAGQNPPDSSTKLQVAGTVKATAFQGDGSGLTGLNASSLTSGTVPEAQLSANIPRLNGSATFTGPVQFNNAAGSFNGSFSGNGAGVTGVNLMSANSASAITWTTNFSGNFVIASSPAVGAGPLSVTTADVNGDGKLDLICANYLANTLSVLTNDGSGGFVPASSPAVGNGPFSVTTADVNGDGKIDLISANYNASTLSVLTNDGSGGFVLSSSPALDSAPNIVVAADVNDDGKVDLICAVNDYTLRVLTNDASGGFVLASSPGVDSGPTWITAADVNGDGKVDLICAIYDDRLRVLTNDASGGFVLASSPHVGGQSALVTAADVNGDGKVDLISANFGDNTLSVLTNDGSGGFVLAASPAVGRRPSSMVAADVNGDGKVDMIIASLADNTLSVLTNNGNAGFAFAASAAVGRAPYSVTATDLNGDGAVDLVCTDFTDNTLTVLLNTPAIKANFSGSGAGLTGLNAANLTGTVADARLSSNVALLNTDQTFSGHNTFSGTGPTLSLQNPGTHKWDVSVNSDGNLLFADTTTGNFTFFRSIDGTVGSGSDLKLKKDIAPLGQTLERVLKLRPVSYRFKTSAEDVPKTLGFIAQEVESLFPEVVAQNGEYKGLAYSEMVPVAIGAIQELNQAVKERDAEIQALKEKAGKLEGLEKRLDALERLLHRQTGEQTGGAR